MGVFGRAFKNSQEYQRKKREGQVSKFEKMLSKAENSEEANKYVKSLGKLGAPAKELQSLAKEAFTNLRKEASLALGALETGGDTLSLANIGDAPDLIDDARGGLHRRKDKDHVERVANRVEARRNQILTRARIPGRAGRILTNRSGS